MTETLDGLISFFSSFYAIRAETVLKRARFNVELIPGPKELSPNCGTALRFEYSLHEDVLQLLAKRNVQIDGVHPYKPRTDMWEAQVAPIKQSESLNERTRKWLAGLLPNT